MTRVKMTISEISEKTRIPLVWAVTIMMSLSGVISTSAVAHFRLKALEKSWEEYKAGEASKNFTDQAQELKIQKLDITLEGIRTSLNRIDARLERIENQRMSGGR